MGAETRQDVDNPIKTHMGSATVGAPDGGRAFHGALKASGIPTLTGVNHMKKVFTPVGKLLKSTLDTGTTRMLRQRCKGKQPCVKEAARLLYSSSWRQQCREDHWLHKRRDETVAQCGTSHQKPTPEKYPIPFCCCSSQGFRVYKGLGGHEAVQRRLLEKGAIHMDPKKAFDIAACTWLHN